MRKINFQGLKLIRAFEGCRLSTYIDQVGILTIGYGHTGPEIKFDMTISKEKADELLSEDLGKFERGVTNLLETQINDNQFSALVSFSYNLGLNSLAKSTLLKYVNASEFEKASEEFLKWAHAGGKENPGLLRRREAEKTLFLS
jgi:lysozyme